MAFSNSYNYTDTFTAASVISTALARLGVLDPDETINSVEEAKALVVLNLILKEWSVYDISAMTMETGFLFLTGNRQVQNYNTTSDYLATFHYTTQLTSAATAAATTIVVDNASSMQSADIIIIKLSNGDLHDTTIDGAPVGTTVTLSDALPSAASAGGWVYSYPVSSAHVAFTRAIDKLYHASRVTTNEDTLVADEGGDYTEMEIIGEIEYQSRSNKLQKGVPLSIFHRKLALGGAFFVWPVGDTSIDRLSITFSTPLQDLDATTNNLMIPPGIFNALSWQLAAELASNYGLPEREQQRLWQVATMKREDAFDHYLTGDASMIFNADSMQ